MKIRKCEGRLKNGEIVFFRSANKSDAFELLKLFFQWSNESQYLFRTPEECTMTLQENEELLEIYEIHPLRAMIIAEKEGKIVATASIYPRTELSKGKHRAVFGITINKNEWGKGLGTEMIKKVIKTAKAIGYTQLELGVFSENLRALKLYEKMGFSECGRIPYAAKKSDGHFMDEILMVKIL